MTDVSHHRGGPATRSGARIPPPRAGHRAAGGGRGRSSRRKKRSAGKIAAITTSVLVLIVAGAGAYLYEQLSGNIKGVPLIGGGSEKPDAFGRTPINIL